MSDSYKLKKTLFVLKQTAWKCLKSETEKYESVQENSRKSDTAMIAWQNTEAVVLVSKTLSALNANGKLCG